MIGIVYKGLGQQPTPLRGNKSMQTQSENVLKISGWGNCILVEEKNTNGLD